MKNTTGAEDPMTGYHESDRPNSGVSSVPNDLYGVLADRRRRSVLRCLDGTAEPLALADLSRQIATVEADGPRCGVSNDAVRQVYIDLFHVHVPKLVESGVVRWDRDRNTVVSGENFDEVWRLLERSRHGPADE